MTTYYPSTYGQVAQPVAYSSGYGQPAYAGYGPSAGAIPVSQVVPSMGAPVVMAPGGYPHHYHHYSLGARLRRFFGLAPSNGYRVKSDYGTWGFMGYSRRQRYIDARTGGEVDRQGRPVYRI